jgi:hypothetical protein
MRLSCLFMGVRNIGLVAVTNGIVQRFGGWPKALFLNKRDLDRRGLIRHGAHLRRLTVTGIPPGFSTNRVFFCNGRQTRSGSFPARQGRQPKKETFSSSSALFPLRKLAMCEDSGKSIAPNAVPQAETPTPAHLCLVIIPDGRIS